VTVTRRGVLLASGFCLLAANRLSHGQPIATIRRVGWVSLGSKESPAEAYAAVQAGHARSRLAGGKERPVQSVYADGDLSRLDVLAKELIGQKVDLIVVGNATTTRALQQMTKYDTDRHGERKQSGRQWFCRHSGPSRRQHYRDYHPVRSGTGKLIGILHEVVPGARRIAVLLNENNPNHAVFWAGAQGACASLNLVALRVVASASAQFGAAIEQIVQQKSQAVVVVVDPVYLNERNNLHALMLRTRLPVPMDGASMWLLEGCSVTHQTCPATSRQVAAYADKILNGAKPADLPVGQATKFELVINLKGPRSRSD
jgi:putative ABC transport system substrate-binding protein